MNWGVGGMEVMYALSGKNQKNRSPHSTIVWCARASSLIKSTMCVSFVVVVFVAQPFANTKRKL